MLFPEYVKRVQSIHIGQVVVQQHQIEIGVLGCHLEGAGAVAGLQHLDLFIQALEDLAQALTYQGMIINNENFQAICPRLLVSDRMQAAATSRWTTFLVSKRRWCTPMAGFYAPSRVGPINADA